MLRGSSVAIVRANAGLDDLRKRHRMEDAQNIDELTDTVIPNLERAPGLANRFLIAPLHPLKPNAGSRRFGRSLAQAMAEGLH